MIDQYRVQVKGMKQFEEAVGEIGPEEHNKLKLRYAREKYFANQLKVEFYRNFLKNKGSWENFKDKFKQIYGEARDFDQAVKSEKQIAEKIEPDREQAKQVDSLKNEVGIHEERLEKTENQESKIGGPGEDFTEDALEKERQQQIYDEIKKEEKLQEMRLARSNNLPETPESPKFQSQTPIVENELRKDDYSAPPPRELPTTKKSQMMPESYLPRDSTNTSNNQQYSRPSTSPFGGRVNDSFYQNYPSQSSIRRQQKQQQQDPDRSISANDDIQSLAAMLAENAQRREQEQIANEEAKHLTFIAEKFNRLSKKRSANTRANITKNTATLNDKLDEEHVIDQEIEELKNEISNLDNRINETKASYMQDKTYLKENAPHVEQHKVLKDEIFKMDVEIEKYKRAYDDLLNQWESGLYSNGGIPNQHLEKNSRSFYTDLYKTKFSPRPTERNRSILDTTGVSRDLNKSYTDKYKDKTNYRGYYEPYVSQISKREVSPMRKILPDEYTNYPYQEKVVSRSPMRRAEKPIIFSSRHSRSPIRTVRDNPILPPVSTASRNKSPNTRMREIRNRYIPDISETQPAARVIEGDAKYMGTEVSYPSIRREPSRVVDATTLPGRRTGRTSVSPGIRIVGENRSQSPLSRYAGPSARYNVPSTQTPTYTSTYTPTAVPRKNVGTYVPKRSTPSPIRRANYQTQGSKYANRYANNIYQPTRGGGAGLNSSYTLPQKYDLNKRLADIRAGRY